MATCNKITTMTEYIPTTTQTNQVANQVEAPPAMATTPRFGIDSIQKEKHHLDNVFDDLDELMDINVQFFPLPETTTLDFSTTTLDFSVGTNFQQDPTHKWKNMLDIAKAISKKATVRPLTPVTKSKKRRPPSTCNESKIESHRQATAKRKRTNGRFKTCQVEWVNVTLTGEFEKNVVPPPEL